MSREYYLWILLVLAALVALSATAAVAEPGASAKKGGPKHYEIGLIGDFPYNAVQEQQAATSSRSSTVRSSPS
jgi:hypothetical protein